MSLALLLDVPILDTERDLVGDSTQLDFAQHANGGLPSPLVGGSWAVSAGKAGNTPTVNGGERLTNADFETWASATDLSNWTEALAGTSTVNREGTQQRSGTFAVRVDVDASNSNAQVNQLYSGAAVHQYTALYRGVIRLS